MDAVFLFVVVEWIGLILMAANIIFDTWYTAATAPDKEMMKQGGRLGMYLVVLAFIFRRRSWFFTLTWIICGAILFGLRWLRVDDKTETHRFLAFIAAALMGIATLGELQGIVSVS